MIRGMKMNEEKKDFINAITGTIWSTMGLTVEKVPTGFILSSVYENTRYIANDAWDAVCFISGLKFGIAGEVKVLN